MTGPVFASVGPSGMVHHAQCWGCITAGYRRPGRPMTAVIPKRRVASVNAPLVRVITRQITAGRAEHVMACGHVLPTSDRKTPTHRRCYPCQAGEAPTVARAGKVRAQPTDTHPPRA